MMGHKPIEAATILVESLGIPLTAEEFNTELYSVVEKLFADAKLMPGKSWLWPDLVTTVCFTIDSHVHASNSTQHMQDTYCM